MKKGKPGGPPLHFLILKLCGTGRGLGPAAHRGPRSAPESGTTAPQHRQARRGSPLAFPPALRPAATPLLGSGLGAALALGRVLAPLLGFRLGARALFFRRASARAASPAEATALGLATARAGAGLLLLLFLGFFAFLGPF